MLDQCVCGVRHGFSGCPLLKRAVEKWGEGAHIGLNAQFPDAPYYVGKYDRGEYTMFGAGKTWDEAFANAKKVKFRKGNGQFEFEEEEKKKEKS